MPAQQISSVGVNKNGRKFVILTNMSALKDILKLSVPERILLVEAIWESITAESDQLPLDEETKEILDQRLSAHKASPEAGKSWEDVKKDIEREL
jgi:putative addiction module component (TIGR02574 family)